MSDAHVFAVMQERIAALERERKEHWQKRGKEIYNEVHAAFEKRLRAMDRVVSREVTRRMKTEDNLFKCQAKREHAQNALIGASRQLHRQGLELAELRAELVGRDAPNREAGGLLGQRAQSPATATQEVTDSRPTSEPTTQHQGGS